MNPADQVKTYRNAAAAIRRLNASQSVHGATTAARTRHQATLRDITAALMAASDTYSTDAGKILVGNLTQEDATLTNIAARKANHAGHRELDQRLKAIRQGIARNVAKLNGAIRRSAAPAAGDAPLVARVDTVDGKLTPDSVVTVEIPDAGGTTIVSAPVPATPDPVMHPVTAITAALATIGYRPVGPFRDGDGHSEVDVEPIDAEPVLDDEASRLQAMADQTAADYHDALDADAAAEQAATDPNVTLAALAAELGVSWIKVAEYAAVLAVSLLDGSGEQTTVFPWDAQRIRNHAAAATGETRAALDAVIERAGERVAQLQADGWMPNDGGPPQIHVFVAEDEMHTLTLDRPDTAALDLARLGRKTGVDLADEISRRPVLQYPTLAEYAAAGNPAALASPVTVGQLADELAAHWGTDPATTYGIVARYCGISGIEHVGGQAATLSAADADRVREHYAAAERAKCRCGSHDEHVMVLDDAGTDVRYYGPEGDAVGLLPVGEYPVQGRPFARLIVCQDRSYLAAI